MPSTKLKVTGVDVFSIGDFQGADSRGSAFQGSDPRQTPADQITLSDPTRGIYKKIVIDGDRVAGACLIGDTEHAAWYTRS